MANISTAKTFTAIVSVAALGAAISFGAGTALAQDKNVTEDQIVRALAPEKKPLTRGLSVGPQQQVDPFVSGELAAARPVLFKVKCRKLDGLQAVDPEWTALALLLFIE